MNIEELFSGIGMVIDDQIFNLESSDKIIRIVENLENKGFPLAKYNKIPNVSGSNIAKFSFVLLDWELVSINDEFGNPMPRAPELEKSTRDSLLQFIKDILENSYLPIFIFSNSAASEIKNELKKQQIDPDKFPIFIKNKAEIIEDGEVKVMEIIRDWIDNTPSIYVLKEWENAISLAKIKALKSLSTTKYWPLVIWKAADADSVNPNEELLDVLTQNIFGLMQPLSIDQEQLLKVGEIKSTKDEVLNVLQAQRMDLNPNKASSITGDIYKFSGNKYYLNIRPTCDCVGRKNPKCSECEEKKCIECPNANKVYLIRMTPLTNSKAKELFDGKYGIFNEHNNEAILGPLINNKFYLFKFQEIIIKKYDDIKDFKIGRILQPFIRHITERYALYIQRQALPRIPNRAVLDVPIEPTLNENQEEPG